MIPTCGYDKHYVEFTRHLWGVGGFAFWNSTGAESEDTERSRGPGRIIGIVFSRRCSLYIVGSHTSSDPIDAATECTLYQRI